MPEFDQREQQKLKMNRLRGWIMHLLSAIRPRPAEFSTLKHLLDARNYPLSSRRLAEELDYLRGEGFVRVSPLKSSKNLTDEEQEKLLLQYMELGASDDDYCARLTSKGVNFQEGDDEHPGITRIS